MYFLTVLDSEVLNKFHLVKVKVLVGLVPSVGWRGASASLPFPPLLPVSVPWLVGPFFIFKASSVAFSLLSDLCFHPLIFSLRYLLTKTPVMPLWSLAYFE